MSHPLASELERLKLFVRGQLPAAAVGPLAARFAEPGVLDDVAVAIGRQAVSLIAALHRRPRGTNPAEDALADMLVGRFTDVAAADGRIDHTDGGPPGRQAKSSPKLLKLAAFEVKKILGQGGMGTVYLAEDPRLGRQVAIKTLKREFAEKPGAVARFLREARTAAQVEHDHICPVYQVGEEDGVAFIAMPFLKGEALDARLKREGRIPVPEAVRIGREIALGLAAAHEAGLIHRDIKPANVWLEAGRGPHPRVRILDFGLARGLGQDNEITAAGTVVGTPAYMAPEQARGKKADGRADLWSLGVILYEMTAGVKPFTGEDTIAILASLAFDNPPPPREVNPAVPKELSGLILRLLAKNAAARPATGHAVAQELDHILTPATMVGMSAVAPAPAEVWGDLGDETDVDSSPAAKAAKPAGEPRRWLLPLAIGGGAAAVLLAAVAVFLWASGGKEGTLLVEADGETNARFKTGKLELYDDGKLKYTLEPGERTKAVAAGKYQVRMVGGDGVKLETEAVTVDKGGKAVVRLTADRPAVAARPDPPKVTPVPPKAPADPGRGPNTPPKNSPLEAERRAAEYTLAVGGRVRTNTDFLPEITTPAALPPGYFNFISGDLSGTKATDAGMAAYKGNRSLLTVNLADTAVTDAGLENLRDCHVLAVLSLANTAVTDAGLETFQEYRNLQDLDLSGTAVTESGLAHLKNCRRLVGLRLAGARVGPGAVAALAAFDRLTLLDVRKTGMTAAAVAQLAERLPSCQITHDGGVAEPAPPADPDRWAAEYALGVGAVVRLDGEPHGYRGSSAPARPFTLTACEFDPFAARRVTDAGLAHFRHCKSLRLVLVNNGSFSDAGLANFRGCPRLAVLTLNNTAVTDAGLAHLKDCKELERLELRNTAVTDRGLAHVKDFEYLAALTVVGTSVGDASLPVLQSLPSLVHLDAKGSMLTAAGATQLGARLPDCTIEVDRQPPVEPSRPEPDRRAALYTLALGGAVQVNGEPRWIRAAPALPPAPFRLTGCNTSGFAVFPFDVVTRHYKGCRHLTTFDLSGNGFAEPWLLALRDNRFAGLRDLDVQGTFAGEMSLPTIEGFTELATLNVRGTRLTPEQVRRLAARLPACKIEHDGDVVAAAEWEHDRRAAVATLAGGGTVRLNTGNQWFKSGAEFPKTPFRLTHLDLSDQKALTAPRQTALTDCKGLRHVRLARMPVTDDDAALFKSSKGLELLDLAGTKVGDDGLANFKGFGRLRHLDAAGAPLTDAAVPTLETLTALETLNVTKTKLTADAVMKLAAKLPKCRIAYGGGVIEPK